MNYIQLTRLEPLGGRRLKDREDIIKYIVNKEDTAEPYRHEIPKLESKAAPKFTEAVVAAMRRDIGEVIRSVLP